jgi:DNA processing protein
VSVDRNRACRECLRDSWLLGALSEQLDEHRRDHQSLIGLIELTGEQLLRALRVPRPSPIRKRYEGFDPGWIAQPAGVSAICRHDPAYPSRLASVPGAPAVLYLATPPARLTNMLAEPAVAFAGPRHSSDYGIEVAHSIARDLAQTSVTVIAGFGEGVAAAAHAGALDGEGPALAVMPGGVDVCYPAALGTMYGRLLSSGSVISELPPARHVRRWCYPARNRLVAALGALTIVVEAHVGHNAMMAATLALAAGAEVGAVPGPITSPTSRGPHALIADGAHPIASAQDALDVLHGVGMRQAPCSVPELDGELRELVAQIEAGRDTVSKLTRCGARQKDVVAALSELEVRGRVRRVNASRYRVCGGGRTG